MKRIHLEDIEFGPVLGTGTVGTVYRARLRAGGQTVAVKVLQEAISQDPIVRARFRLEMAILQQLDHPNIIRFFGGGEMNGSLFFAMELLEHGNVRDLLERFGQFSWQEVASIGRQVCSALQCAHNNGIVHRDLKPSNLFLDAQANVKLGDFGIARDTKTADITTQGLTVGTHAYMAPEQIRGERLGNGKADLYSLGCVLFELLTGRKPFEGSNFAVVFEQHLHTIQPRVTDFVPNCPEVLSDIVHALMQKDPNRRPFNARTVQGVLHELLDGHESKSSVISIAPATQSKAKRLRDVAAASVRDMLVQDPGQRRLARKLEPAERPQATWRTLVLIGSLIAVILLLAVWSNR